MITRITITALASVILAAAAYGIAPVKPQTAILVPVKSTIIEKNQAWPVKGLISMDPCASSFCQNVLPVSSLSPPPLHFLPLNIEGFFCVRPESFKMNAV